MVFSSVHLLSFSALMSVKHIVRESCELCGVISCVSTHTHDSSYVEGVVWRRHALS